MKKLRCFIGVVPTDDNFSFHSICFANNSKEAKKIMWKYSELQDVADGNYLAARAKRCSEYDHLLDDSKCSAYIVRDNKTLRKVGWMVDGDESCITCGLYEMDGDFKICDKCGNCEECGCDCEKEKVES